MEKQLRLAQDSVRGLKGIVPYRSAGGETSMNDGRPMFEAVVMIMVEQIGNTNRRDGPGCFNCGESGMIVNNIIGEQRLIATAAAEIESGSIVQGAGSSHSGEEQIVLAVPEAVL